jgi:hypothetical protein
MSGGHGGVNELGMSGEMLDRVLNNPQVQERLYRPREIITTFDMPYVAGYSTDGNHIYLDRHLPEEITLVRDGTKKVIRPAMFLAEPLGHEPVEWSVMDALGWSYGQAHSGPATGSERRKVLMYIGPGWWSTYQRAIAKYIKADAKEKLVKVPKDLDLRPMIYDHDTELLEHLRKVMNRKISKRNK